MTAIVYKIWSEKGDKVYIGSTTNLQTRWSNHKSLSSRTSSSLVLNEYGVDFCKVEVLEEVELDQQKAREKHWIRYYMDTCVNEKSPLRTREEQLEQMKLYNREHKEKHLERARASYQQNKEKRNKERVECACGELILKVNKTRHLKSKQHLAKVNQSNV
jgi:predicted GIY-YIG superfamily endonuclease